MSFAAGPDFDAVTWQPLGCDSPDMIVGASPSAVSFAGNQANLPAFYAYDANYLYFRYRMDSDPRQGGSGFQQFVWTALMQVPSGNRFQYQYQLSLNGKGNTVEIWQNTVASNIRFPHFQDDAEVQLYSAPVGSLARALPAGTSFNGDADWFVDFAFPVQTMIAQGVISSAADLGQSFFFPATSTNPNNYSKSYLNCPFQPYTALTIQKSVAPAAAPANAVTPVVYTIEVGNPMGPAVGVVIQDPTLPAFFNTVAASATSDDPGAVLTVVSTNPLQVTSPTLGAGKHVTVQLTANAEPGCSDVDFVNTASAYATNSLERDASATLDVQAANGPELCDGKDNNCNGQVDEGANLCDDGNVCTIDTCGGASGCSHEWIPGCVPCQTAADCDDGNACNGVETCDPATGCHAGTPLACDDGNACNGVETCDPKTGCQAGTPLACDDGNACNGVETCDPKTGCHPGTPLACDDGNACNGVETCDPKTGCQAGTPLACDDGNACNGVETCDPKTGCHAGTPLACDDGNACNGVETCDPKTGCHAGTPLTCDDGNACNGVETCDPKTGCHAGTPLICGHGNTCTVETGCAHCSTATQCDDGDACTTDVCESSVCGSFVVPGCKHCTTAADCDDGNTCTTETCDGGVCGHKAVEGCTPCKTAADCDDSNPCTSDACGASGSCELTTIPGCERCTTAADCASDGDACTVETCSGGMCTRPTLPGCTPCKTASDCNDGNTCTTETCDAGVCGHRAVPGCKPCTTTTDCNDSNPCTIDVCSASGSCELTTIAGCRPCKTAADCDDGNACTTDVCAAGVCQARPIAGCGVELCADGIDNDGDGKIDCQDEDCAKDPACAPAPVEICGDCIDNDGDGLVDYEDPDCCGTTDALTLRRMAMRMRPKPGRNTLRLRGGYAALQTRTFNPADDGVTLQIADHSGQVYCHTIPLASKPRWLKHGVFRFRDKTGTAADGLRRVRFKIRKDGRVVVRAVGRKMSYRNPTGTDLRVTLRVGNQCLQATPTLRSGKAKVGTRITFP